MKNAECRMKNETGSLFRSMKLLLREPMRLCVLLLALTLLCTGCMRTAQPSNLINIGDGKVLGALPTEQAVVLLQLLMNASGNPGAAQLLDCTHAAFRIRSGRLLGERGCYRRTQRPDNPHEPLHAADPPPPRRRHSRCSPPIKPPAG